MGDLSALPSRELFRLALSESRRDPSCESTERWDYVHALCSRPDDDEVFQTAVSWCENGDPVERQLGADVLAQLGHDEGATVSPRGHESLPVLLSLLKDEHKNVLNSALIALGHLATLGIEWEAEQLRKLARHPDEAIRYAVAFALGGRPCDRDPLAVEIMIKLIRDPDTDVRNWAAFGLGVQSGVDSPKVRDALLSLVGDPDQEARCEAMIGLAKRKDERVIPAILAELASDDVSKMGIEAAGTYADLVFVNELENLLEDLPGDEDTLNALARCKGPVSDEEA